MPSVTGGKRSDAIHMCDCLRHTKYHCRLLGEHVSCCVHKEKRKKAFAALMNTNRNPTEDQLNTAYSEGHNGYHDGRVLGDNPYSLRSEQGASWRDGWKDERNDDPYWEPIKRIHKKY